MTFPTVSAVASTNQNTDTTSHPISLSVNVDNDICIVFFNKDGTGAPSGFTGGWSDLGGLDGGSSSHLHVYAKKMAAGNTLTITTGSGERSNATCYTIPAASWHGTSMPEVAFSNGDATVSPDAPNLTPSWGAQDTLWFCVNGMNESVNPTTQPTNYTNVVDENQTGSGEVNMASCRRELNAASENPGAWTWSSLQTWAAATVAVRPAAGGASADANITLAKFTADGSAKAEVGGQSNITLGKVTAVGAAQVDVQVQASITLNAITAVGAAQVDVQAQANVTLNAITAVGFAVQGSIVTADANITLNAITAVGAAQVDVQAQANITLNAITAVGSTVVPVYADASITLNAITAIGAAQVDVQAQANITLNVVTAVGAVVQGSAVTADANITLNPITAIGKASTRFIFHLKYNEPYPFVPKE